MNDFFDDETLAGKEFILDEIVYFLAKLFFFFEIISFGGRGDGGRGNY